MIIMNSDATREQIDNVIKEIKRLRLRADVSKGEYRSVIGIVGDERQIDLAHFTALPGVKDAMRIETPYKLISKEYGKFSEGLGERKVVKVGNIDIGGDEPVFIAGPCAVESKEQLFRIAEGVKKAGAHIYSSEGNICYGGNGIICVHSKTGGNTHIQLKNGLTVQLELKPGSTVVLDNRTGKLLL